jgi:NADH-ubiquinone oxidoreductase chain 5
MILAVVGGSMLNWLIFSSFPMICLPLYLKLLTLFVCLLGGLLGYYLRNRSFYFFNKSLNFYYFSFFNGIILFLPLFSTLISFYPLILGFKTLKSFDQGWSEYFGGQKIYFIIKKFSIIRQFFQNNNLKIYLMIFVY